VPKFFSNFFKYEILRQKFKSLYRLGLLNIKTIHITNVKIKYSLVPSDKYHLSLPNHHTCWKLTMGHVNTIHELKVNGNQQPSDKHTYKQLQIHNHLNVNMSVKIILKTKHHSNVIFINSNFLNLMAALYSPKPMHFIA